MLDIDKMIKKMLNKTLSKPVTEKKYINNRKFAGASIAKQKQWKSFSPGKKILLRKLYKDSDKDRVPDKWDCQPYNKYRQDSDINLLKAIDGHEVWTNAFGNRFGERVVVMIEYPYVIHNGTKFIPSESEINMLWNDYIESELGPISQIMRELEEEFGKK
jgi:hypothetical protein